MKPYITLLYGFALLLAPFLSASTIHEAQSLPSPAFTSSASWRAGFYLQEAPSLHGLEQRVAVAAAQVRTAQDPTSSYFAFTAVASKRRVEEARFYLLGKSGSYDGDLRMSLVVFDSQGNWLRTVTSQAVDLQSAPGGVWTVLDLSNSPSDQLIMPGELLAYHFEMSNGPGGDLIVQTIFEVTVAGGYQLYLPSIKR